MLVLYAELFLFVRPTLEDGVQNAHHPQVTPFRSNPFLTYVQVTLPEITVNLLFQILGRIYEHIQIA